MGKKSLMKVIGIVSFVSLLLMFFSGGAVFNSGEALAKEIGKFNVNVNVIAPGMVMTEMARNIPAEFLNKAIDETVLGRVADPKECANVVAFFCSDRSRHITGEVIKVDGGQYI